MSENESKFTHEEMLPMKVEYGENLSMTDISERLRGLVPHCEDPSDYTEDDLLIYQGANLIEAYKDEIDRLRNTLDQTRRFALSGEMDTIVSDEIERLREALTIALSALVAATSLLKRSEDEKVKPSRAVASNKIFRLMMADYERAEDNARAALLGEKE